MSGELVNGFLPSYQCPACNRKVHGGGSTPVHVDELRTGWNVHNACCGYTWFEPDEASHE